MSRRVIRAASVTACLFALAGPLRADDFRHRHDDVPRASAPGVAAPQPPPPSPEEAAPVAPRAGEPTAPPEAWPAKRPDYDSESTVGRMVAKLGRGIVNILTGWIEIPKQMIRMTREEGAGKGLTLGLFKGIGMAVVRSCAGGVETALFLSPYPPGEYRPLLEPAIVFD